MKLRLWLSLLIILCIVITDQIIKFWVKTHMCLYDRIFITDWFQIFFTENHGMAFGMDFIGTMVLTLFRIAAVIFFIYLLTAQARKRAPLGFIICLAFIIAGAMGNIIDNSFYGLIFSESVPHLPDNADPATLVSFGSGYGSFLNGLVVDMFYFPLFTWPESLPVIGGRTFFGAVFNFADSAISCGAVALILFYHRYVSELISSKTHGNTPKKNLVDDEATHI